MPILSVLLSFIVPPLLSQQLSEATRRVILTAQDSRDAAAISAFLSDENPGVRALAAFAAGSVQDTTHVTVLSNLLSDSSTSVRTAASFALGQYHYVIDTVHRTLISKMLVSRLGRERSIATLTRLVEALGKVGDDLSLNVLVASGQNFHANSLKCEAALSVGRYAYRGITSKTAAAFAAEVLNTIRSGEEWKAAYAFTRINDTSLVLPHINTLIRSASHADANVRMFVASALGKCASSEKAANVLASLVTSDPDWRVQVNAVKAIAKMDSAFHTRVLPLLLQVTADSNVHLSLAAISSMGEMQLRRSPFATACRKVLVGILSDSNRTSQQKREAGIVLARIFGPDAYQILADKFRRDEIGEDQFVPALAFIPDPDAFVFLVEVGKRTNTKLRREALEGIQTIAVASPDNAEWTKIATTSFLDALESDDMTVVATAASALARPEFVDERAVPALLAALRRLKPPEDSDALVAVIQTLGVLKSVQALAPLESELNNSDRRVAREAAKSLETITGRSYMHLLETNTTPAYTDHDWEMLDRIRKNPDVHVNTSKGSFVFQMLPDEAPFTCVNFASLIERDFFDGLLFHRVVPNFVIQGGDPRGDGWGGPGYSIRSEFGFNHFERGMVGVASSGKDTEGCQWFVTHCSTPHLDGRYTIFGKVTSGMDVVDAIQVGDRIEKMRLDE